MSTINKKKAKVSMVSNPFCNRTYYYNENKWTANWVNEYDEYNTKPQPYILVSPQARPNPDFVKILKEKLVKVNALCADSAVCSTEILSNEERELFDSTKLTKKIRMIRYPMESHPFLYLNQ